MSTHVGTFNRAAAGERSAARTLRDYFFSDIPRSVQTLLGLIWCIDGGLQFQAFMYSHGFVQMLKDNAVGQPDWLHDSMLWGASFANRNLTLWDTLFALVQCVIGLGLLYRPSVKLALVLSLLWAFVVLWFGEGFAMLFMGMAQPMTGSPGVLSYGLVALLVWPSATPGGILTPRGAKTMWATLWLIQAYLWLIPESANNNATSQMLTSTPSGIGPLNSFQHTLASAFSGAGLVVALVLAALSATIGVAVACGWRARPWLYVAIALNLIYWVIPQGLGGVFAGGATDLNAGPLFVLLAVAMLPVVSPKAVAERAG